MRCARWVRSTRSSMTPVGIDPSGRPALVLGAGGASRAAVWALASLGARPVLVLNRTPARAHEVVTDLAPHFAGAEFSWGPLQRAALPAKTPWGVIVNATSLGHHGAAPHVHPSCYSPQSVALELAY